MAETYDNLTKSVSKACNNLNRSCFHEPGFTNSDIIAIANCIALVKYYSPFYLKNVPIWQVRIAMVGKYVGLTDSYLSVVKVWFLILPLLLSQKRSNIAYKAFSPIDIYVY